MIRDKLIDLITVGIARACVKEASGEQVDMAAIIADVLLENDVSIDEAPKFIWVNNGGRTPTREELVKAVEELKEFC